MPKKHLLILHILFLLLLCLGSCKKTTTEFSVNGQLDNIEDPYFYAAYEYNGQLIVDTILVDKKGNFSFKGRVDTITVMSLYFNSNTQSPDISIFVDKQWTVDLSGDVLYSDLISAKGGAINDDLTVFKQKNKDLLKSRAKILTAASADKISNDADKNYIIELKNINFQLANRAATYVKSNPTNIASVVLINSFFKDEASIDRLDENLNILKGAAATFPLTIDLQEFSAKVKLSAVGATAPNFTLVNSKGKDVSINDFKSKYLLLSFGSTICSTCNKERTDLIGIYASLKKQKKNIEFLTVLKDIEEEPLPKASMDSIKWALLTETSGWAAHSFNLYNIHHVPYNILISPSGIILDRDLPVTALEGRMKELEEKEIKKH